MSDGTKKILIIAGAVGLLVIGVYALFYEPSCGNGLFRELHSSCFGPK